MKIKHLSLLICILALAGTPGCGGVNEDGQAQSDSNVEKHTVSYKMKLNGCDTGKHTFEADTKEEAIKKLCEALLDGDLNNHCAESMREKHFFDRNCDGVGISWARSCGADLICLMWPVSSRARYICS